MCAQRVRWRAFQALLCSSYAVELTPAKVSKSSPQKTKSNPTRAASQGGRVVKASASCSRVASRAVGAVLSSVAECHAPAVLAAAVSASASRSGSEESHSHPPHQFVSSGLSAAPDNGSFEDMVFKNVVTKNAVVDEPSVIVPTDFIPSIQLNTSVPSPALVSDQLETPGPEDDVQGGAVQHLDGHACMQGGLSAPSSFCAASMQSPMAGMVANSGSNLSDLDVLVDIPSLD